MSRARPRRHWRPPTISAVCPSARLTSIDPDPLRRCTTEPAGRSVTHWNAPSSEPPREQAAAAVMATTAKIFFTRGLLQVWKRYAPTAGKLRAGRALAALELDTAVYRLDSDTGTAGSAHMRTDASRVETAADRHLEVGIQ